MTTNRTPVNRSRKARMTPEVIETYRRALKLHNDPKHNDPEAYEYSREYLNACSDLHELLGRKPWEAQVLDTIGADEAPACFGLWSDYAATWPEAAAIQRELDRLCLAT